MNRILGFICAVLIAVFAFNGIALASEGEASEPSAEDPSVVVEVPEPEADDPVVTVEVAADNSVNQIVDPANPVIQLFDAMGCDLTATVSNEYEKVKLILAFIGALSVIALIMWIFKGIFCEIMSIARGR